MNKLSSVAAIVAMNMAQRNDSSFDRAMFGAWPKPGLKPQTHPTDSIRETRQQRRAQERAFRKKGSKK